MIVSEPSNQGKDGETYAYIWAKYYGGFYSYDFWLGLKDEVWFLNFQEINKKSLNKSALKTV